MQGCYIYGAGERGLLLKERLSKTPIKVIGYIDGAKEKIGKTISGAPCFSLDEAVQNKKSEVIFISPFNDEGIKELLSPYFEVVFDKRMTGMVLAVLSGLDYDFFYPIGHFYSQYPKIKDVEATKDKATSADLEEVLSIDFNMDTQLKTFDKMRGVYNKIPDWINIESDEPSAYRYRYGNPSLSNADAIGLFSMLSILSPQKIIEVGSGYTSAIMLDYNEKCLGGGVSIRFIEPYADRLRSILKPEDNIQITEKPLQEVSLDVFSTLKAGDVLFIDSTHVSKYGSDVNYLFFEIFPRLNSGVVVHLHDIFYPFEYPHAWIKTGMVWNEDYLLRAFLQYNQGFEILFFQNYLEKAYRELFVKNWPLANKNVHGGSFWMRKK